MDNNKLITDFKLFAKDKGISSTVFDDIVKNSLTPVVMEERNLNITPMDVYSRLLYDRIIYWGQEVNSDTCNLVNAQLLYLDSVDNRDISLYINSPGGSVIDGLSVIDVMNFIKSDVSTTCVGMAASMGAVLLSCGTKGKRYALPHSRIMIHQVSTQMRGSLADLRIEMEQIERCREDIYEILADKCGKSIEEITQLCDRNRWYIGAEGLELGIIDKILEK